MKHLSAALIVCIGLGPCAQTALANTCGDDITSLEKSIAAHPLDTLTAPQSIAAKLHHQPTPASVSHAKEEAQRHVDMLLREARRLMANGDDAGCLAKVGEARSVIGAR